MRSEILSDFFIVPAIILRFLMLLEFIPCYAVILNKSSFVFELLPWCLMSFNYIFALMRRINANSVNFSPHFGRI